MRFLSIRSVTIRCVALALIHLTLVVAPTSAAATDKHASCDLLPDRERAKTLACLVSQRASLMDQIAQFKSAAKRPIYDADREAMVSARVEASTPHAHRTAALLFVQIQMDLAKVLQAAWIAQNNAPPPTTSLGALRERLNELGDAITSELVRLRTSGACRPPELAKALADALATLDAPVEDTTRRRYANMLASAACTDIDGSDGDSQACGLGGRGKSREHDPLCTITPRTGD